jgi:hypothetical protein
MNKLLCMIGIMSSFAIINAAYANDRLCLKLTNASNTGIQFIAPSGRDPGWQPTVEPGKSMVIGSDYTGCKETGKICFVKIKPIDNSSHTEFAVAPGGNIAYYGPTHIDVDNNARIKCD